MKDDYQNFLWKRLDETDNLIVNNTKKIIIKFEIERKEKMSDAWFKYIKNLMDKYKNNLLYNKSYNKKPVCWD